MLEKIGLPAKPSLRGNTWVVDASHCQGCSSQFSFINRKHHCRRCGGIFCGSCTQQRMLLRGQGDSPVRICDPCKKLEEAARFEMRNGHKNKGGSKLTPKNEAEVLNEILGVDSKRSLASTDPQRAITYASGSSSQRDSLHADAEGDILRSLSVGTQNESLDEMGASPDELHQQALEEKNKYRILKGEGKPGEALKAYKRGKELERQAGALEVALRKNRRRAMTSTSSGGAKKNNDEAEMPGKRSKLSSQVGGAKDDLAAELKELGWTDEDVHETNKKPAKMTLEGELSSLIGEVHKSSSSGKGAGSIDKSQVIAHKKKALVLKREGKLAEAKEELKKAKVLEKQLEEHELLAGAEDSDDELSALIRNMDDDKSEDVLMQYDKDTFLDFQPLVNFSDDYGLDGNIDVMDEDMNDPEMALALKSLGWDEDSDYPEESLPEAVPLDRESLLEEIRSLKREALTQKRAGNVAEAMAQLKKAKLLEKDMEDMQSQENASFPRNSMTQKVSSSQRDERSSNLSNFADESVTPLKSTESKVPQKSKLMIQRELLALKKKALALRREGRVDEAEEELRKGSVLERQLEEMENTSKARTYNVISKDSALKEGNAEVPGTFPSGEEEDETEVTEQDMRDPALLSLLSNLGWDEDGEPASLAPKPKQTRVDSENVSGSARTEAPVVTAVRPRRSKAEMQRELLGLKRKALTLRRQGESDEADEVLDKAKVLEAQIAEMEVPKKEMELNTKMDAQFDGLVPMISQNTHGSIEPVEDVRRGVAELSVSSSNEVAEATSRTLAVSFSDRYQLPEYDVNHSVENLIQSADERISEHDGKLPPSVNMVDLSTAVSSKSSLGDPSNNTGNESNSSDELGIKYDNLSENQNKSVPLAKTVPTYKATIGSGSESFSDQTALRQEVLARKKKAVALKKEGKLVEAREELRQAKLLEKKLVDNSQPSENPTDRSVSTSKISTAVQEEQKSTTTPPKQISSRDRFKLQQESLAHKRQAMKLRREGRTEEAEAELELAKALEAQLEEHDSQNTSKSEAMDGVVVEDLLDPQLLSALKAIGLGTEVVAPRRQEKSEPAKASPEKGENSSQERSLLEEKIKAEKVKALNFKRAGKQAEALASLRQAKLFEKKLSSLPPR
ncbi:enolase-phosphatase E1-like [Papaver somniferum]|uniref:enolase-phosphatase E1-like n=1 Tax=Papaver somniferum TaxID=3469 RepID=UPI000E705B7F|nr:enolase-phosphatase E1-like [Papaver somniferum]